MGVLVAISIPIFTSQLEKSREAVDLANIRSAYAIVQAGALTSETSTEFAAEKNENTTFSIDSDGNYQAVVTLTQQKNGWTGENPSIGGITTTTNPSVGGSATVLYTKSTGVTSITFS